jgi:REP element-mobilizing transposase RayT
MTKDPLPPIERGETRGWHSRGYLPHLDAAAVVQHVTYRLADSLPLHVLTELERELQRVPQRRVPLERRKRIERTLDAGHGACLLREPQAAALVQSSFRHFDGVRYRLLAWVVMPNHVHVLVEPLAGHSLPRIVSSWKSYTARRLAALPGPPGSSPAGAPGSSPAPGPPGSSPASSRIWHREYWDRYIRDEGHLTDVVRYIHENPVQARLVGRAEDWPWSSARWWGEREGRAGLEPGGPGAALERGGPGGSTAS